MNASFRLAAALACAQLGISGLQTPQTPAKDRRLQADGGPAPRAVASKITDVTVYQGQALVTREVNVPEWEGTIELLVAPLPAQVDDSSLYAEGTDGLRVLSSRDWSQAACAKRQSAAERCGAWAAWAE
jgi:hypothetical protein